MAKRSLIDKLDIAEQIAEDLPTVTLGKRGRLAEALKKLSGQEGTQAETAAETAEPKAAAEAPIEESSLQGINLFKSIVDQNPRYLQRIQVLILVMHLLKEVRHAEAGKTPLLVLANYDVKNLYDILKNILGQFTHALDEAHEIDALLDTGTKISEALYSEVFGFNAGTGADEMKHRLNELLTHTAQFEEFLANPQWETLALALEKRMDNKELGESDLQKIRAQSEEPVRFDVEVVQGKKAEKPATKAKTATPESAPEAEEVTAENPTEFLNKVLEIAKNDKTRAISWMQPLNEGLGQSFGTALIAFAKDADDITYILRKQNMLPKDPADEAQAIADIAEKVRAITGEL